MKNQKGSTLIVTTLIIASISVLLLVSLGISSRNLADTSRNLNESQFVFYAVEGAMNETLQRTINNKDWPLEGEYTDSYMFDEVEIDRSIITSPQERIYEITGHYRGVYRKLIVTDDLLNNTLTFEENVP